MDIVETAEIVGGCVLRFPGRLTPRDLETAAQPVRVAFAADLLSSAVTQLANLAERQLDLVMDPHRNTGLPPSLAAGPGQQHGLTGVEIAATSIVVAMRRAAVPAAMQSIPTIQHNQDHRPVRHTGRDHCVEQVRKLRWVQGALAVALRQAAADRRTSRAIDESTYHPKAPYSMPLAFKVVQGHAAADSRRPCGWP
ncbi:aromatic amino acid lyase [Nocardia vinacea]|uniref:aromatic amino acid lyase n=1 Tax=Nocardia vinacea TaxID=96468 RepID=UPI0003050438|nr:aromatic amino acid lyase [Nocardia vinacea]